MVTLKFKKVKTLPDSEFLFSVLKRNLCRFLFLVSLIRIDETS